MNNGDESTDWVRDCMPAEEFFGQDPQADFDYWSKLPYWTPEEATALSFGYEPRIVDPDECIDPGHPWVVEYKKRLEKLRRTVEMKALPAKVPPKKYIDWANDAGIPFSPELAQIIQNLKPPQNVTDEAQLNPKEKQSYQKLCLGLACAKYEYKVGLARNPAHSKIASDLRAKGINLDEDTVRKCLQSASDAFGHFVQEG